MEEASFSDNASEEVLERQVSERKYDLQTEKLNPLVFLSIFWNKNYIYDLLLFQSS